MYAGEMLYKEMFSLESEFLKKWDQLTGFDSGLAEKTETINPPARLDDLTAEWERTDFASVSEEQTGKVNRQSGILSEKIDTLRQHFVMEKGFKIEHMIEVHLRRVRRTLPCVLEVWSLFRHMDYQPVETKMTPVIRPLFAVNDKILHLLKAQPQKQTTQHPVPKILKPHFLTPKSTL